jgi:plastocyanin
VKIAHTSVCIAALYALSYAAATHAGPVTVSIASSGSISPEDTIVVLDPLDVSVAPAGHIDATIDQKQKQFAPKVSVFRTGTTVTFTNSDHIRHQVYSFSPSKTFTLKLYEGSPQTPIVFDKPGLVVLGCNIHDNMLAFVGVVDSPYFGKADNTGRVALTVPAGRYRMRLWHPNLRAPVPDQEINVPNGPLSVPLKLDLAANVAGVAPWPE